MNTTGEEQELRSLQQEVDTFVDQLFSGFVPTVQDSHDRTGGKVIRDPIHGFLHLHPWEVEILDSPLVQRLRYIHQNALAYLVYPSANHSRLEHSLGMAKVVQDVARAFRESKDKETRDLFDNTTVDELRLAALLHDTGHGFFSHLSESLIKSRWSRQFNIIGQSEPYLGKQPGEILSHMLVTSRRFRQFLDEVKDRYSLDYNVDRIALYIVGRSDSPIEDPYKADLITGPIDADKLDYLPRDSYFTGIKTEVDTQHIIQSLQVWDGSGGIPKNLVVGLSGATSVEQMHFAKLSLFPAMYQHQKVRSLECMVRGILEKIWEAGESIGEPRMRFEHVTDFLRISDMEFLTLASREPLLQRKARCLTNRNLLRRALHISASVLQSPTGTLYNDLVKLGASEPEDEAQIREIREEIFEEIPQSARIDKSTGEPLDVSDLWLDIPKPPEISRDIMRCYVNSGESQPISLRKLFPIDAWLDAYAANKWTAHVFGHPDEDHLKIVNRASIGVLENRFNLKFLPRASQECKLQPPD